MSTIRKVHEDPKECPIIRTIDYIGNKWKPVILVLMVDGPIRFGRIQLYLPSISRKILTEQLREMEASGLITRVRFIEKVPRVEYALSEKGRSLAPVLQALYDWGVKEMVGEAVS